MHSIISATSGLYIVVDDIAIRFDTPYAYKDLIRYDMTWRSESKTLTIWEPENKAGTITFTGSEEEYNEWCQPLVDLWQAEKDRQEQEAIDNADITEATQLLQKYDNAMTVYHDRINLAIINGDTELESSLRQEMLAYDPSTATQALEDLQHYCKQCGHELDIDNICTNASCKRKTLQDNIVTAVEEKEAKQAKANQE